jgi:pimeloyl-ACP methyl ester carboxylesterase
MAATRQRALLLLAFLVAGCAAPPGPKASIDEVAGLRHARLVGGRQLSWLETGDPAGRVVLFIHGTPGEATGWADYLLQVPAGYRYIAVDRPGFGGSGPADGLPSLKAQATAIATLLPPHGTPRPVLVGHSLGAPIAAEIAADYPGRVGALVLVAGSLDPAQEKVHWAQPLGEWPLVRSLLPAALRNANRELMALKPQLQALAPRLGSLACEVVVVHGTADPLVPYANTAYMKEQMSRARLDLMKLNGRDHFLPWNSMAAVKAAIATAAAAKSPPC